MSPMIREQTADFYSFTVLLHLAPFKTTRFSSPIVHNCTTENSIVSNLHRVSWAVSAKPVKPLNSEAFDYCELCSVHAQQCCFSLAEYTEHTLKNIVVVVGMS